MSSALSYCGQEVQKHDPDRFLLSLFMPAETREDLWALFAFNHEIAKTREVVSETTLGLIRLQWWRDAIGAIYETGEVLEHETLQALARAIQTHDLPRKTFESLIYAREFDLEDVLPSNIEGTLNYVDFTSTPLMKLALQIAGGDPDAEPVQPVAMNYALVGLVRSVLFHASQRRCYLPEDAFQDYGMSLSDLYENRDVSALPKIIERVLDNYVLDVKPEHRFLKVSLGLSDQYYKKIKGLGYDVFHPKMQIPPGFKEMRLALSAFL